MANKQQLAIIYARVSPKGRRTNKTSSEAAAESLDHQLDIVRRYCDSKNYLIVEEFADESMSGDDEDRPGMWQAVDACKRGYRLVFWRYERLARSVFLQETIRRELNKISAQMEAVDGHNGDTDEDQLVRGILAYVHEYEKRVIAKRTKAHMQTRQRNGEIMGRIPPMGTEVDPDNSSRLRQCDDEIRQMQIMLDMKRAGLSYREITRRMNHQGERFRHRRFQHSAVRRGLLRWLDGRLPCDPPRDLRADQ